MERIGLIGLGRMGSAMAARFAQQGHSVTGWTRSGLEPARATALGITAAPDIAALVAASDVVMLSLFDDAAVVAMLDALLNHDLAGKLVVETSTVTTTPLLSRADALRAAGAGPLDAPISGGPEMVAAGVCGLFVGGAPADAERFLAVAAAISDKAGHVGPLGNGMVMKTINNGLLQGYVATLHEMMQLAKRAGLPKEMVLRILAFGPAGTPMLQSRLPKILGEDETVGFSIDGAAKDADVFVRLARDYGIDAETLETARELWLDAVADGLGGFDLAKAIADAYDTA